MKYLSFRGKNDSSISTWQSFQEFIPCFYL